MTRFGRLLSQAYPPAGPEPVEYEDEAPNPEDVSAEVVPWARTFYPAAAALVRCQWGWTDEYSDENRDDGTPISNERPETQHLSVTDARGAELQPLHLSMTDAQLSAHFSALLTADAVQRAGEHRAQAARYRTYLKDNPAVHASDATAIADALTRAEHLETHPLEHARARTERLHSRGMHCPPFDGAVTLP